MISTFGFSQKLSRTEKKIRSYVEKQTDNAIDLIEKVVNINSGSLNIQGNKEVGNIFQKELDKLDGMRLGLWPQRSELLGAAPRRNSFWENHLTPLCSLLIDDRIRSTSNLNIINPYNVVY